MLYGKRPDCIESLNHEVCKGKCFMEERPDCTRLMSPCMHKTNWWRPIPLPFVWDRLDNGYSFILNALSGC